MTRLVNLNYQLQWFEREQKSETWPDVFIPTHAVTQQNKKKKNTVTSSRLEPIESNKTNYSSLFRTRTRLCENMAQQIQQETSNKPQQLDTVTRKGNKTQRRDSTQDSTKQKTKPRWDIKLPPNSNFKPSQYTETNSDLDMTLQQVLDSITQLQEIEGNSVNELETANKRKHTDMF